MLLDCRGRWRDLHGRAFGNAAFEPSVFPLLRSWERLLGRFAMIAYLVELKLTLCTGDPILHYEAWAQIILHVL
jgi:hypothetical protein